MLLEINVLASEKKESKKGNVYYQNTVMVGNAVGKLLTQSPLDIGERDYKIRFKNDNFLNLVLAIDERVED